MPRTGAADTVGCDIGGSDVKLLLLRRGRPSQMRSVPCPADHGKKEFTDRLVSLLRTFPANAAGIALPGFLDEKRRRILHLSNLPKLDGLDLAARLERRLKWKIILEADSNAGAIGEARLGAGRGIRRLLYLTMGTGLGAALTVKGIPVRVSNNTIGHIAGPRKNGKLKNSSAHGESCAASGRRVEIAASPPPGPAASWRSQGMSAPGPPGKKPASSSPSCWRCWFRC